MTDQKPEIVWNAHPVVARAVRAFVPDQSQHVTYYWGDGSQSTPGIGAVAAHTYKTQAVTVPFSGGA